MALISIERFKEVSITATSVSMNDFVRQWRQVGAAATQAMERVGHSGWYILGPEVERFERALGAYWGRKHVIGVANGMDAIEIGLRCMGVGRDHKVLTTPLTAFATTLAILRVGATPVYVDVDACGLMNLAQAKCVLECDSTIRAVVPVHLYGFSLNLRDLEQIQSQAGVPVLEDCAQSIGARHEGRLAGSIGRCVATSFYPTKNLGAIGDAGALLTDDAAINASAKGLRNYGQSSQYHHEEIGLNSRLDELHAAILHDAMMPLLAEATRRRREVARRYLTQIDNPMIELVQAPEGCEPVWHLFPILTSPTLRDNLRAYLQRQGVTSGIHYPKLTVEQPALAKCGVFETAAELTQAMRLSRSEVSLPIHPFLTDTEVELVINACNRWQP